MASSIRFRVPCVVQMNRTSSPKPHPSLPYSWWSSCMKTSTARSDSTWPVWTFPHLQRCQAGLCLGTNSLQHHLQYDAQASYRRPERWGRDVRQVPSGCQPLQPTAPPSPHQDTGREWSRTSSLWKMLPSSPTQNKLYCASRPALQTPRGSLASRSASRRGKFFISPPHRITTKSPI